MSLIKRKVAQNRPTDLDRASDDVASLVSGSTFKMADQVKLRAKYAQID